MFTLRSSRVLLVVLALVICSGTVYAGGCPLIVTGNGSMVNDQLNVQLAYTPGFSGGLSATVPLISFGGSAFTIDTSASPGWMSVTATASTAPTNLTITGDPAAMLQAGVTATTHPTFTLKVAGDTDCPVTVDVLYLPTAVTMDSSSYLLRFTGTAVTKTATITVQNPVSADFTLDPTLPLPGWLTATLTSPATSGSPGTILFDTTAGLSILKGMPPGNVTVPLRLLVTGCASCSVNFNVVLSVGTSNTTLVTVNGTSTGASSGSLVAASGTPIPISWAAGNSASAPVYVSANPNSVDFTATCSFTKTNTSNYPGNPCYFTQGGNTSNHLSSVTSLATTFPTAFNVVFDPNLLDTVSHGAVYGDSVTVSVLVSPAAGSPVTLKYQFSLSYPTATLSGVSPTSIAAPPAGSSVTAVLTGTGFVPTSAQTGGHATRVYMGTVLALEPAGLVVNVVSSTNIILTIPASLLQTGKVLVAVMNQPLAATLPTAPTTSTFAINVTTNPVIQAVTDAASYAMTSDPTVLPTVSPFEVISIFGTNFIPASGNGALPAGTSILVGTPDTVKYLFPTALANVITTKSGTTTTTATYNLKVGFQASGTSTTVYAYLLFATPNQINAIVPSSVITGTKYSVIVSYGVSTGTPTSSDAFFVKAAAAHPGIFTSDASGTGQGAVINNTTIPTMNQTSTPADANSVISIYMTGLGTPNSTATSSSGTAGYPGSCLSPAAYSTAAALGTNIPIDGAVIQSSKLGTGKFAPCLQNTAGSNTIVTVTFACKLGGGSLSVDTTSTSAGTYAGFVADAVAGLYQVNVPVPAGLAAGDCPITVNLGNTPFTNSTPASQSGVTVAISGN